jgi:hypothetical protein
MKTNIQMMPSSKSHKLAFALTVSVHAILLIFLAWPARCDLFVDTASNIGTYSETAGAATNPSLITGLSDTFKGFTVSNGFVYVPNYAGGTSGAGSIAKYTTSGTLVNSSLITGLTGPWSLAESGGQLFVGTYTNGVSGSGTIGLYNATTGTAINPSLITGLSAPFSLTLDGANLFVQTFDSNSASSIGKYTTSGTTVSTSFLSFTNQLNEQFAVSGGKIYVETENPGTPGSGKIGV